MSKEIKYTIEITIWNGEEFVDIDITKFAESFNKHRKGHEFKLTKEIEYK